MDTHLPPERIEQMITTAVRRGRRQQRLRPIAKGAAVAAILTAVVLGVGNLLDRSGSGPDSTVANPATSPADPSLPVVTPPPPLAPSTTTPVTTINVPTPDPNANSDFLTAYTEEERELILQQVSGILKGRDMEGFTVIVSRTTWVAGLAALSPGDEIVGADDTPAFALRISGPLGETTVRGGPFASDLEVEVVGTHALFGNDGRSFASTQLFLAPGGSTAAMPAINPNYEHDATVVNLQQVNLPTLDTAPSALTDDEQGAAVNLLTTFENLLPPEVEVTEVLNSSPDGAVLTLQGPDTSTRVTIALWHLTPGATGCSGSDCTAVQVDDGSIYIDATFDSPEAPSRSYTYRRSDDAAIYFTMGVESETNQGAGALALALTEDQMVPLLTDPGWTPFLDRKKAEPPQ